MAAPAFGVTVLLTYIVQAILAGLLAPIIARGVGGQQISAADAWRATRPRLPSLLLATLLVLLAGLGPLLITGLIAGIAALAGAPAPVYAVIVLLGLVALVLTIWFSTMLSLVTPIVVLENASPGRALARSWRLVHRSFWRVFGITLLAGLIVAIAGGILQLPFTLLGAAAGSGVGGTVILVIGAIAAGTVTRPITAGVTVLLYVDMRMRKEGLDLALRTSSGSGQPGSRPARPPSPPARAVRGRLCRRVAAAGGRPGAGRTSHGRGGPAAVVTPGGPAGSLTGRAAGRRLARAELSKTIYHPHEPLTQRILNGITDLLSDVSRAGRAFPGGWWAAVALAAPLAALITVVVSRTGPLARSRRSASHPLADSGTLSADDHRLRAGRLAAASDYAGAVLERVRAIARELDERAVLTPRPGRTANEMAEEAAAALPAETAALRDAALMFDDICYGERPGTREGYALVSELDRRISAALPGPGARLAGVSADRQPGGASRKQPEPQAQPEPQPGQARNCPRAARDDRTGTGPVRPGPGHCPGRGPGLARARQPGPRGSASPAAAAARRPAPLAGTAHRAGAGPAGRHRDRPADTVRAHHRLPRPRQSRIAGRPGARRPPGPARAAGDPG